MATQSYTNGADNSSAVAHEYHGALMAMKYAWIVGKYAIAIIIGALFWVGAHGWIIPPAKQTDLDAVVRSQNDINEKLKTHDQILTRLDNYAFSMSNSLARIEGTLAAAPAPISPQRRVTIKAIPCKPTFFTKC